MNDAYLAIDLGAESGRVIAVWLRGEKLSLHEVHRFPNQPIVLPSGLHWDITGLWREIVVGLTSAAAWSAGEGVRVRSVGVDAWGVDWALISDGGELIGLPHAYRDDRNQAACQRALQLVSPDEIYDLTGIQLMPINTIFSLFAQQLAAPETLATAAQLLFIPDLFHFWLSGRRSVESTIASTSQMIDIRTREWSSALIQRLSLPKALFAATQEPGTILGPIRPELAQRTGLSRDVQVVLPAAHDTASAVAAVPATANASWCFLSSGTWSLLGAELSEPCTSAAARQAMFTNEWGLAGRFRFLKNIAGLWLLQELRRDLSPGESDWSYAQLTEAAAKAPEFAAIVDVSAPSFQQPDGIQAKIAELCRRTGQSVPQDPGAMARCCLESLALAYRRTFQTLCRVLDRDFNVVHLVGGGGQNRLLCQMTADAVDRPVIVGPYEATAIGNGLTQALALGQIGDLNQLRQVVAESSSLQSYHPSGSRRWAQYD
jgi:rhamnulokinase